MLGVSFRAMDEEQLTYGEEGRYWRLFRWVGGCGLWFFVGKLVLDYLRTFGVTLPHMSRDEIYGRVGEAVIHGLFMGFFIGFPMWLARERFKKPGRSNEAEKPLIKSKGEI